MPKQYRAAISRVEPISTNPNHIEEGATYSRIGGPRLRDRVVAELQDRILRGELRPGERLPTEGELGELLGVSRSVVRDAIRTLATRGLVSVRQRHGIVVTEPSAAALGEAAVVLLMRCDLTLAHILEARAAIEIGLGSLATSRGTAEDWDSMERHLEALQQAIDEEDWRQAHTEHMCFHLGLIEALHLPALEVLLVPMHQIVLLTSLPLPSEIPDTKDKTVWDVKAHFPILEALRSGDGRRTEEALTQHFKFGEDGRHADLSRILFRDVPVVPEVLASIVSDASVTSVTAIRQET